MQNHKKQEILEQIAKANVIHIAGHTNPDGDAIGACLAFGTALEQAGRQVYVILEPYAAKYSILPNQHLVRQPKEKADLFLALDCGDFERLGEAGQWFEKADKTINIDHHGSNTRYGDFWFVDGAASSTCELVYDFLEGTYPIDTEIAAALYTGILYDTGAFRHTSTAPKTMRIAAALMETGIDFTKIYHRFFDSRSFSELKLMGQALQNAKLYLGGTVICATITAAEIAACHGSSKELDAIVNYLKGVEGIQIACFLYEKTETDVKASFRAGEEQDVCVLAQKFGGGGHVKAAGCTITAPLEQAKEMILDAIAVQIGQKEQA